jgi:hypothetical protein
VTSLGADSPIQIGYITIPPDWTEDDYHLIEHLQYVDGHENIDKRDRAEVHWNEQVKARSSRTQLRDVTTRGATILSEEQILHFI